jgi:hypothetical protein
MVIIQALQPDGWRAWKKEPYRSLLRRMGILIPRRLQKEFGAKPILCSDEFIPYAYETGLQITYLSRPRKNRLCHDSRRYVGNGNINKEVIK